MCCSKLSPYKIYSCLWCCCIYNISTLPALHDNLWRERWHGILFNSLTILTPTIKLLSININLLDSMCFSRLPPAGFHQIETCHDLKIQFGCNSSSVHTVYTRQDMMFYRYIVFLYCYYEGIFVNKDITC